MAGEDERAERLHQAAWPDVVANLQTAYAELAEAQFKLQKYTSDIESARDLFHRVIESMSESLFLIDLVGRVIRVNPAAVALLGRPDQEIVGRSFADLIGGADIPGTPWELTERAPDGRLSNLEVELRAPEGRTVPLSVSCGLVRDKRGKILGTLVVARDTSERRRAEEALRQYAERLRSLWDIDQAILAARSAAEIAEAALERVGTLVPCYQAVVAVFDADRRSASILAAHSVGRIRVGAGARLPLEESEELRALRRGDAYAVDEMRQAPELPRLAELMYDERSRSYVSLPLTAEGEVIGSLHLVAATPGAFSPAFIEIAREIAGPLAVALQQARLREELERYANTLEQRVAERTAALQESYDQLEAFSFTVAHDLRAPLRAIAGFTDAMLDEFGRGNSEVQAYGTRIVAAARRMDALILDLLEYSRLSRFELALSVVDLGMVCRKAFTQLEGEIHARRAAVTVEEPLPHAMGHHAVLVQVVANLVSNATKFMPSGTTPEIRVRAEVETDRVRIWVEDNGIGIAPEHQERIFRVFERLHRGDAYPGTGIGLAIVRKAVERMGGRVGVESDLGRGSRFWVELLAAPAGVSPSPPAREESLGRASRRS